MAFNEKEAAGAFERIAKGEEGPETRTDLELYLLDELVANGTDAVVQILHKIPTMGFSFVESDDSYGAWLAKQTTFKQAAAAAKAKKSLTATANGVDGIKHLVFEIIGLDVDTSPVAGIGLLTTESNFRT